MNYVVFFKKIFKIRCAIPLILLLLPACPSLDITLIEKHQDNKIIIIIIRHSASQLLTNLKHYVIYISSKILLTIRGFSHLSWVSKSIFQEPCFDPDCIALFAARYIRIVRRVICGGTPEVDKVREGGRHTKHNIPSPKRGEKEKRKRRRNKDKNGNEY